MSRSRKSVSIPTYKSKSMRLWRRSVNKIVRARAKQLLRTTVDFDNLIMPVQTTVVTTITRHVMVVAHGFGKCIVGGTMLNEKDVGKIT